MYYLRIDDLRVSLLCHADSTPVLVERNHIPGAFADVLRELSTAFTAEHLDVLVSGPTTIVPSSELPDAPGEQTAIFSSCFNFVDDVPREVFASAIPALYSHLLFGVKAPICQAIREQFAGGTVRFESSLSPLLRHFSEHYDTGSRFRVYLNCRQGFVDVFAFDGRQLVVLNSFPVSNVGDVVYYAIAFSKTIGLDMATTPFFVVGDTTMASSVVAHLGRFVSIVSTRSLVDEFGNSPLTQNATIPYDLAVHILCAS